MAHPKETREEAVRLRIEKNLSSRRIAQQLQVPTTTVWGWLKAHPRKNSKGSSCHRCGAPWEGTYKQNSQDMAKKGRHATQQLQTAKDLLAVVQDAVPSALREKIRNFLDG